MSAKSESHRMLMGTAIVALLTGCAIGGAVANQPHMTAALEHLNAARAELALAEANKGGHRAKALNLIDQAIMEVQLGINYAGK